MLFKNNMLRTKSSHPVKDYSLAEQKHLAKQGCLFIVGMTKDSGCYAEKDIHQKLKKYVLTPKQLEDNEFPLSSGSVASTRPGKKCVRCGVTYFTTNSGTNSEVCNFHPGKLSDNENSTYSCCQRRRLSEGCESATHVTRVCDVAFVETQPNVTQAEKLLVLALDTEMCRTDKGLEVTKLSVVDAFRRPVFITFVRPRNRIVDYITNYSGVTEKDLRDCTSTLENVQQKLLELIHSDTILIGHTLQNDLSVLGLVHKCVVDTSIMFPNTKHPHRKNSLKNLALQILKKRIQDSSNGHDCTEDAATCIDLVMRKIYAREPNE